MDILSGWEKNERTSAVRTFSSSGDKPKRDYILIIDDDPAIVSLLVELLHEDEGFPVRTAYSIQQAVNSISPESPPGLVLLDMTLPGEEVSSFASRLRHLPEWYEVPLVLCSGQDNLQEIARQVGAAAYLTKPFSLDAVAELAHRYIPGAFRNMPHAL